MWLRTLLIALLIIFVVRALMRLMYGIRQGAVGGAQTGARGAGQPAVKMIADPVCGTFVVPGKALQVARGGQTHYFCSEQCRDRWTASN